MENKVMSEIKVDKKQFNGVVYSRFSDVPVESIASIFVTDSAIEGILSKCKWYTERVTQEEVTAKLALLINLLTKSERINVLDYGGGLGQLLISLEKHLLSKNRVIWEVFDTEEMIGIAKERIKGKNNLFFHKNIQEVKKADILFFRQSLQVLENPVKILTDLTHLFHPKIIFMSGVPAGKNEDYVSLVLSAQENKGHPCWIFNEERLLSSVNRLGYSLIDKFSENITINLSNFPDKFQMDDERKNHARGYIFLREGAEVGL